MCAGDAGYRRQQRSITRSHADHRTTSSPLLFGTSRVGDCAAVASEPDLVVCLVMAGLKQLLIENVGTTPFVARQKLTLLLQGQVAQLCRHSISSNPIVRK